MMQVFTKKHRVFTLIELLVVIAIIGILSSIVLVSLNSAKHKAKVARAHAELNQLRTAIGILEIDTNLLPGKLSLSPCVQDPEIYLDRCAAGIQCTDGGFPGWSGPYMNVVPKDPWGTYYYFDPDYRCRTFVKGCEGVPDNTWLQVAVSFGPNKSENYDDGDNVVVILCR